MLHVDVSLVTYKSMKFVLFTGMFMNGIVNKYMQTSDKNTTIAKKLVKVLNCVSIQL